MKSLIAFCALFLALSPAAFAGSDKPPADELVKKAVDAFGGPEVRTPAGGRDFEGQALWRVIVGGSGSLQGPASVLSRGKDFQLKMTFGNSSYSGENILTTDGKVIVGEIAAAARSRLGNFIEFHNPVLDSGLFGGVLSTAWPFWNGVPEGVKLTSDGLKKIDGEKLYEVQYQGPKQGDMKIFLYFDPESGRHIATEYRVLMPAGNTGNINAPGGRDVIVTLQEKFSEFHPINGMNLPLVWTIRWSQEEGSIQEWRVILQKQKPTLPDDAFKPSEEPRKR